jgi:hypothetical protein
MVFDHIDGFHPRGFLPFIDFAKVENLPLEHLVADPPVIFNIAPIAMFFSVLESWFGAKKHTLQFSEEKCQIKRVGRHYKQNRRIDYLISEGYLTRLAKICLLSVRIGKVGLEATKGW